MIFFYHKIISSILLKQFLLGIKNWKWAFVELFINHLQD